MKKRHKYSIKTQWTGNTGKGTLLYDSYERSHNINAANKKTIECSSDSSFRGDNTKYNPEELFVASLSSCHMLWYLHLCADNHITVMSYNDEASGVMEQDKEGGKFIQVLLKPIIEILEEGKLQQAMELHNKAHSYCYIANSCNFPINHEPEVNIKKTL